MEKWRKRNSFKFGFAIILCEPQNDHDDCYFCAFDPVELKKELKNPPSSAIQA